MMDALAMPPPAPANRPGRRALPVLAVAVAVVGHLVVLVPFTVASGLLAPLWAVVGLHGLWLAGALVLLRLARHRPLLAPLVPAVNAAVLWAALSAGGLWLGWTP